MHVTRLRNSIKCSINGTCYHLDVTTALGLHDTDPPKCSKLPLASPTYLLFMMFLSLERNLISPHLYLSKYNPHFSIISSINLALISPAECISHLQASLALYEYLFFSPNHIPHFLTSLLILSSFTIILSVQMFISSPSTYTWHYLAQLY